MFKTYLNKNWNTFGREICDDWSLSAPNVHNYKANETPGFQLLELCIIMEKQRVPKCLKKTHTVWSIVGSSKVKIRFNLNVFFLPVFSSFGASSCFSEKC